MFSSSPLSQKLRAVSVFLWLLMLMCVISRIVNWKYTKTFFFFIPWNKRKCGNFLHTATANKRGMKIHPILAQETETISATYKTIPQKTRKSRKLHLYSALCIVICERKITQFFPKAPHKYRYNGNNLFSIYVEKNSEE